MFHQLPTALAKQHTLSSWEQGLPSHTSPRLTHPCFITTWFLDGVAFQLSRIHTPRKVLRGTGWEDFPYTQSRVFPAVNIQLKEKHLTRSWCYLTASVGKNRNILRLSHFSKFNLSALTTKHLHSNAGSHSGNHIQIEISKSPSISATSSRSRSHESTRPKGREPARQRWAATFCYSKLKQMEHISAPAPTGCHWLIHICKEKDNPWPNLFTPKKKFVLSHTIRVHQS